MSPPDHHSAYAPQLHFPLPHRAIHIEICKVLTWISQYTQRYSTVTGPALRPEPADIRTDTMQERDSGSTCATFPESPALRACRRFPHRVIRIFLTTDIDT